MLNPIESVAIAVAVAAVSGCQTGQYQAATGPSVGPGQTLEARCRLEASRASSRTGTGNMVKTVAAATIGGIVGNAVGGGIRRYGYGYGGYYGYGHHGSYRGVGTVVGAGAGAAVGNSMAEDTQAIYDVVYTNCMNHRYTGPQ